MHKLSCWQLGVHCTPSLAVLRVRVCGLQVGPSCVYTRHFSHSLWKLKRCVVNCRIEFKIENIFAKGQCASLQHSIHQGLHVNEICELQTKRSATLSTFSHQESIWKPCRKIAQNVFPFAATNGTKLFLSFFRFTGGNTRTIQTCSSLTLTKIILTKESIFLKFAGKLILHICSFRVASWDGVELHLLEGKNSDKKTKTRCSFLRSDDIIYGYFTNIWRIHLRVIIKRKTLIVIGQSVLSA